MEAALVREVGGDLLVAVQAQMRLSVTVAAVVALSALLFVLRVGSTQLPGHEQRLGVHGFSTLRQGCQQDQSEYQGCATSSSEHVDSSSGAQ